MYSLHSVQALQSTRLVTQLTRTQVRHFHPTRPASFSMINLVLDGSTAFIHGVHTVSCLPWVASIPLTAVLVRTFIGFPLQIYTRYQAQQEKRLQPLLSAWALRYQQKHSMAADSRLSKRQAMMDLQKRTSELHKRWGISRIYRPMMFLQLPVFIALMESLRGMSGNNNGIIAWLLSLVEPSQDPASPTQSLHLTVEPTFANEGALWFPDLLAGDTTGVLPVLLTASILGNVMTGWKTKPLSELSELPKPQMFREVTFRGLRLLIQVLACQVGVASYVSQMPTALLLYWITSTNVATLQTWILEKKVFKPPVTGSHKTRFVGFEKPGDSDPFQLKNLR
ncbi:hypothetical protein N7457_009424 [Penicillium paradoxum]|uniref:uncharacterized protein n=1 Tax=Penicillium paradoxum TaxID=176176 RepID=UPI00254885F9|nr:uncharacterized protein N7457_009424 [Penicillium paradoxum]KAJ5774528.1 hypothetical protein N7457_009424 [Penicillium paradoxum]